jgi:hypothetical protein
MILHQSLEPILGFLCPLQRLSPFGRHARRSACCSTTHYEILSHKYHSPPSHATICEETLRGYANTVKTKGVSISAWWTINYECD